MRVPLATVEGRRPMYIDHLSQYQAINQVLRLLHSKLSTLKQLQVGKRATTKHEFLTVVPAGCSFLRNVIN